QSTSFSFQCFDQPLERLNDPPRLNSQRHVNRAMRLVSEAAAAGDSDREELMSLQPLAAMLHEARRVPPREGRRVFKAMLALIGLGENDRQRPRRPAGALVGR